MTTYHVAIKAKLTAQNFASANKKLAALEKRVKSKDLHLEHISMDGVKR